MWQEELNEFNSKMRLKWMELDAKVPPILHHYTDTTALQGIVTNKCLWATHIRYLNDKLEMKYAFDLVRNTARCLIHKYPQPKCQEFLNSIIDDGAQILAKFDLYVISLSESRDLLSQWRGYGKKYKSLCIGFDPNKMSIQSEKSPYTMRFLQKVIYDYDLQIRLLTEYITEVCDILSANHQVDDNVVYIQMIGLFNLLSRMKHSSWSEENEWRIVVVPEEYEVDSSNQCVLVKDGIPKHKKLIPSFKQGENGMIPYLPVNLFESKNGIKEIIIPQSEFFENSKTAIAMFLNANGIFSGKDVRLEKSNIPIVY